jgi:hypothetical protein
MRVFVLLQIEKGKPVNCVGVFGGSHAALSMIPRGREHQFTVIEHILNQPTRIRPGCAKCDDTGLVRDVTRATIEGDYYFYDCPNGCTGE